MTARDLLSGADVDAAGLTDWRRIGNALRTRYRTNDFATGLRFVVAIGEAADAADHHPDVDLRYGHADIALWSHDVSGITSRDVALARTIEGLAGELGVVADPSSVTRLDLALDTPDLERIKPFWRAVLGYDDHPRAPDELRDASGHLPPLWFQSSGPDEPRQRFHLDVLVAREQRSARVDAAVAAGGSVVGETPTFTVLADADGNRVCICIAGP